jgi:hypothetical protein
VHGDSQEEMALFDEPLIPLSDDLGLRTGERYFLLSLSIFWGPRLPQAERGRRSRSSSIARRVTALGLDQMQTLRGRQPASRIWQPTGRAIAAQHRYASLFYSQTIYLFGGNRRRTSSKKFSRNVT